MIIIVKRTQRAAKHFRRELSAPTQGDEPPIRFCGSQFANCTSLYVVFRTEMLQNIVITFRPYIRVHALDMLTIQNNIYQPKLSSIIIHFV